MGRSESSPQSYPGLNSVVARSTDQVCLGDCCRNMNLLFQPGDRAAAMARLRRRVAGLVDFGDDQGLVDGVLSDGDGMEDLIGLLKEDEEGGAFKAEVVQMMHELDGVGSECGKLSRPRKDLINRWKARFEERLRVLRGRIPVRLSDHYEALTSEDYVLIGRIGTLRESIVRVERSDEEVPNLTWERDELSQLVDSVLESRNPKVVGFLMGCLAVWARYISKSRRFRRRGDATPQINSEKLSNLVDLLLDKPCSLRDLSEGVWALGYLDREPFQLPALIDKMASKFEIYDRQGDLSICDDGDESALLTPRMLALPIWACGRLNALNDSDSLRRSSIALQPYLERFQTDLRSFDAAQVIWGLGRLGRARKFAEGLARNLLCTGNVSALSLLTALDGLQLLEADNDLRIEVARRVSVHPEDGAFSRTFHDSLRA